MSPAVLCEHYPWIESGYGQVDHAAVKQRPVSKQSQSHRSALLFVTRRKQQRQQASNKVIGTVMLTQFCQLSPMCPATQNYRTTGKIAARRFKHIPYASKCGQQLYTSGRILGRAVTIVCIYACMHVCICICICVCECKCICTCVYVYEYV